ncbi:MAG TPA: HAMP domain-containing sensor histidine kinase [Selenomonadales bacterium]|nr:HAMP domain-containing sensor histidine kinase [Selenomonadales bacterium]
MIMRSLLARIMAFSFLSTVAMVSALALIVNYQVSASFSNYIYMYHGSGMHGMMRGGDMAAMMGGDMMAAMMGRPEIEFLASFRQSLTLVAIFMTVAGAAVSYYLARSISTPVLNLNKAVNAVTKGDLDITVSDSRKDEIGQLAKSFNSMAASLKSSNVLRQRFLAGVAHELRTPLAILKANLEGIADGVVIPDAAQVGSLTEEIDRLTKIVEDLRDLSLLEAGQLRLEFSSVAVNDVLADVVNRIKPLADGKSIHLALALPDKQAVAWADPTRFCQIVYNLVVNAIKYTPVDGTITLSATAEGDKAVVSVADTGVGIPPENLPFIFDYFYRVDSSRSKHSGGSGLGLAIVRQLVNAQRGTIKVNSVVGQGSSFSFSLPVKPS